MCFCRALLCHILCLCPFLLNPRNSFIEKHINNNNNAAHVFSVFTVRIPKPMKINHQWNMKEMDERIVTVKLQKAHKSFIKGVHPTRAVPSLLKPFNRFVWVRDIIHWYSSLLSIKSYESMIHLCLNKCTRHLCEELRRKFIGFHAGDLNVRKYMRF